MKIYKEELENASSSFLRKESISSCFIYHITQQNGTLIAEPLYPALIDHST